MISIDSHLTDEGELDLTAMGETVGAASALDDFKTTLPERTLNSIKRNGVCLKGPLMTPVGSGFRSVNVAIRPQLDRTLQDFAVKRSNLQVRRETPAVRRARHR